MAVRVGVTCLAALRSYTLLGLSGCVVKFSFLLTFSAKIVFVNKIITIVPLLYCSTKQHPPSLPVKPLVFCGVVGVPGVVCAAAMMLVFFEQQVINVCRALVQSFINVQTYNQCEKSQISTTRISTRISA